MSFKVFLAVYLFSISLISEDVFRGYISKLISNNQFELELEDGTGQIQFFLVSTVPAILDERFNNRSLKKLEKRFVEEEPLVRFKSLSVNSKFQHIGLLFIADKDHSVNEDLVSRGILRYKKSSFYDGDFSKKESLAREKKMGMWGAELEPSLIYAQKKFAFLKGKVKKLKEREADLNYKLQPSLREIKLKEEEIETLSNRLSKEVERLAKTNKYDYSRRRDGGFALTREYKNQKEKVIEAEEKVKLAQEGLKELKESYKTQSADLKTYEEELKKSLEEGKKLNKVIQILQ